MLLGIAHLVSGTPTPGAPIVALEFFPDCAKMPPNSFMTFWVIFGTSNQLLAALSLLLVTVWVVYRNAHAALAHPRRPRTRQGPGASSVPPRLPRR